MIHNKNSQQTENIRELLQIKGLGVGENGEELVKGFKLSVIKFLRI